MKIVHLKFGQKICEAHPWSYVTHKKDYDSLDYFQISNSIQTL